ncbi:hypothetical protein CC79DRAFT_1362539 [Sarocladium strictum]
MPSMETTPSLSTPVNSAYMRSLQQGATRVGRRARGLGSWRSWQKRTSETLAEIVNVVRQVQVASETQFGDAHVSSQIASERTTADLQQIKNGIEHLNDGINALTPEIKTAEATIQDSLKSLQTSKSDAVDGDLMAILQEVRGINLHLIAADFDGGSAARLLLQQRDQAQKRADALEAEKKMMSGELECSRLGLKEEQHRRKTAQAQLVQTITQLQEKLKIKSGELKAAQESLLFEQNTSRPGKLSRGNKICDRAFKENWETMAYKIRALAHVLSQLKRTQYLHPELEEVAHDGEKYIKIAKDKNCNRYIFQALLWKVIDNDIFQGLSSAWESHPLRLLQSFKQESMGPLLKNTDAAEKLGAWISDGTYHLRSAMDHAKAEPLQELVNQASDKLLRMVHPSERTGAGEAIKRDAHAIFLIALEMHKMMLSSRAFFETIWVDPGLRHGKKLPFDPSTMESLASSGEPKYVLWALTPILYKTGNADGQHYDQDTVLEKAQVICD